MFCRQEFSRLPTYRVHGRVRGCTGSLLTCGGLDGFVAIGDVCRIERGGHNRRECEAVGGGRPGEDLLAEVVAFREDGALLLPYGEVAGVGFGARVTRDGRLDEVRPTSDWLGRVLDPLARPLDGGPPPATGGRAYAVQAAAPPAFGRRPLGPRLDLGVRALNLFAPCCEGQRMGILAGAGVGKSTLLSMLARFSDADALVIGLIGERGREVNEFLHGALGAAGLARSAVVVATSDLPALLRRRAAQLTLTIAEALRDEGLRVLCLMDSLTRYAMALREIYLAAGEPPTSKGYPPGVFAELPRLLERAGPGPAAGSGGSVTGLFTVLVEGDDTASEPVADAVRAILDGHVVLDRAVAEGGRFPAVDVLRSVSRTAPGCYAPEERPLVERARRLLRTHAEMAELIQRGASRAGGDPRVDEAIRRRPALEALLAQDSDERSGTAADFARLAGALGPDGGGDG